MAKKEIAIRKALLKWYLVNRRELPWRLTADPYTIWISEIILQQTRVIQGLPYYLRFITAFPDVPALANASEQEVLRQWQGLGYYSRARNLHAAAKTIVEKHEGIFPDQYEDILNLKGIGPYTAAAIASIAFRQPYAAVDGNVYRVLSRLYANDTPVNTSQGIKEFAYLAQSLLEKHDPGNFNEAMMELGATICLPRNPLCEKCPVIDHCEAYRREIENELPVKLPKTPVRTRYFHYLVLKAHGGQWMKKRSGGDIWQGLHDFPLLETGSNKPPLLKEFNSLTGLKLNILPEPHTAVHLLTHQKLHIFFYVIKIKARSIAKGADFRFVPYNALKSLPLPRPVEKFLASFV
ncbi:MAG: A/G-specific adenine glycosylase [Bacteroidota bacterium]|nr:A/G-specific adenine glycosylase [Bacteroidota bacterium]